MKLSVSATYINFTLKQVGKKLPEAWEEICLVKMKCLLFQNFLINLTAAAEIKTFFNHVKKFSFEIKKI